MTNITFVDASPYTATDALMVAVLAAALVGLFVVAKRSPATYGRLYMRFWWIPLLPAVVVVDAYPEVFYRDWMILWGIAVVGPAVIFLFRNSLAVIDDPE